MSENYEIGMGKIVSLSSGEPTDEQLQDGYAMDCVDVHKLERAYKAMIAASPSYNRGGE